MADSPARLDLELPDASTAIWIGNRILDRIANELSEVFSKRRVFVVTSSRLRQLHAAAFEALAGVAPRLEILEVSDGEAAKTVDGATELWRTLLRLGGKRDSLIVAVGGGSVGDLAGFVAGTFLRGVEYLQIPTTLLAQVDSSIGGKTAVNLPEAKNSVGVFHHPLGTIIDTAFLETLPGRQLRSGLYEVIKTAVMLDAGLFARLEGDFDTLLDGDAEALTRIVEPTVAAKVGVVERDPREADLRRLLNFGHTLGHALELTVETLEHGEAVGHGMLFAIDLAVERGLSAGEADRIRRLISRLGPPPLSADVAAGEVIERLERDKKAREGGLAWVLPSRIGTGSIRTDVSQQEVEAKLERFLARGQGC